ncbi:P22 phage major capsid protein family protein, partial [Escherichia coli]|uniref:P22 phage major capsid protein family protein n=1 Tax=Escherichia coli TaxID=562 RepID=UPI0025AE63E4
MALNEGQMVTLAIDEVIETITSLTPMAQKAGKYTPPAAEMQRSSNTIWMPVEQESPTQEGWDLTGQATGILELNVLNRPGFPGECFICELRLPDHRFRWK